MATALLITRDDLVRFTAVNGNVDTDKFIQFVKIAQDIHIQNYLGTKLLQKIQADITANTLAGNYATLVNTFVKPNRISISSVRTPSFIDRLCAHLDNILFSIDFLSTHHCIAEIS